jgi:hypothetical protein
MVFFLLGFVLKFVFNHVSFHHCYFFLCYYLLALLFYCTIVPSFGFFLGLLLLLFLCIGAPSCRCFAMLLLFPTTTFVVGFHHQLLLSPPFK